MQHLCSSVNRGDAGLQIDVADIFFHIRIPKRSSVNQPKHPNTEKI